MEIFDHGMDVGPDWAASSTSTLVIQLLYNAKVEIEWCEKQKPKNNTTVLWGKMACL